MTTNEHFLKLKALKGFLNRTSFIIAYVLGILFLVSSCTVTQKINYGTISVPQEGGIRFIQFTENSNTVVAPYISVSGGRIAWYAAPLIALSGDGEKIAFLGRKGGKDNIFIRKTSGGKTTVQRTFKDRVADMAFSPDGEKIAFSDASGGNADVFMINADQGAAIQQITSTTMDELGPMFSPDNRYVFFTKAEQNIVNGLPVVKYYVWNFDRETSLQTQFGEGSTPVLMPDGKSLLVTRINSDSGLGEIWMINIDSGQETLLLSDSETGFSSPSVAPDGKSFICVGASPKTPTTPPNLDIYSLRIDGTGLTQLTFHPGHDASPIYTPDGKSLFFLSQRGDEEGTFNVWKMNIK